MSYIGRQNLGGAYRQLDDISSGFDGSDTTHTMQVSSQNVTVGDVNQIILSLGGVIQKPGTDFTVSGSTLTFTTAPASGLSFFAILLGSDNGGTVTPTDGSVTTDKFASDATLTTTGTVTTQGTGTTGGTITLENTDTAGSNGDFLGKINFKGNDSSSSASGTRAAIEAKVVSDFGSTELHFKTAASGASATDAMVMDSAGVITKPLQTAFRVKCADHTDIPINSYTNLEFNDESAGFDVGSNFNTSTYTFTAPVTGIYAFNVAILLQNLDSAAPYYGLRIEVTGRAYWDYLFTTDGFSQDLDYFPIHANRIVDMDANDTAYVRVYQYQGSGQTDVNGGASYFSGYLLG